MDHMLQLAMIGALVPKTKRKRKPKVSVSAKRSTASNIDYRGYDWKLPSIIA